MIVAFGTKSSKRDGAAGVLRNIIPTLKFWYCVTFRCFARKTKFFRFDDKRWTGKRDVIGLH
jgi:hypothetical protein